MICLRRASLLIPCMVLALGGCSSEPMPQGEIPQDFLFSYSYEPLDTGDTAPTPDRPVRWRISVDVGGLVDYEVEFGDPDPVTKRDDFKIEDDKLDRIYHAVRDARLYDMQQSFTGDQREAGKETFYVVSRNQPKEVTVVATKVPNLTQLRNLIYEEFDIQSILKRPPSSSKRIILDYRTAIFYPADCPAVADIPPEQRREYADPWSALDAGGIPSQEYDPFEGYR